MFERFTERARRVMALANQKARDFNHEYIGPEHILLGLAKEGSGVGANALKNLNVDFRRIRMETDKRIKCGPDNVTYGKLPQTPEAKKVLAFAIEEARNLNHNYVGTEHLLLGLLRPQEPKTIPNQVLEECGLTSEKARDEIMALLGAGTSEVKQEQPTEPAKQNQEERLNKFLTADSVLVNGSSRKRLSLRECEFGLGITGLGEILLPADIVACMYAVADQDGRVDPAKLWPFFRAHYPHRVGEEPPQPKPDSVILIKKEPGFQSEV